MHRHFVTLALLSCACQPQSQPQYVDLQLGETEPEIRFWIAGDRSPETAQEQKEIAEGSRRLVTLQVQNESAQAVECLSCRDWLWLWTDEWSEERQEWIPEPREVCGTCIEPFGWHSLEPGELKSFRYSLVPDDGPLRLVIELRCQRPDGTYLGWEARTGPVTF